MVERQASFWIQSFDESHSMDVFIDLSGSHQCELNCDHG